MAGGRGNTKFNAETVEQARKLAMLGLTQEEMAKFFEVGERTFKDWLARYDDLRAAVKEGGAIADAEVTLSLFKRACGYSHPEDDIRTISVGDGCSEIVITPTIKHYPPDTMACMYWLNNRQRGRWARTPDPAGGLDDLPPTKVIFEVRDARSPDRSSEPEPAAS